MKYFVLIWAGLWRKKTRTILTMLSIVVAFLLFGLLQGINQGIKAGLGDTGNNRLWTTEPHERDQFHARQPHGSNADREGRAQHCALEFLRRLLSRREESRIPAFATNIDKLALVYPGTQYHPGADRGHEGDARRARSSDGRWPRNTAGKSAIRFRWARPSGPTTTAATTGLLTSSAFSTRRRSSRNRRSAAAFWINYDYWDEARKFDNHRVHQFIAQIDDPKQAAAISHAIDKLSANSPDETRTQTENAALQSQLKQLADINFIANSIVGAVMFTLLFLTANTMMQSVRERIPELAVLKTLGFTGGTVSSAGAHRVADAVPFRRHRGVAALRRGYEDRRLGTRAEHTCCPSWSSSGLRSPWLLAIISGLPPALRAQRLNIVDALAGR